jgi:uncharacterized protein
MDLPFLLAVKVAASASIGILIGLERTWAHKEAGVRSFAIAALLGTLSWLVAPTLAYVQVGIVLVVLLLVNVYGIGKSPRAITATAVKVLTTAVTRLHAPADAWVEQAREEELIGTGGVTRSGRLYAELAENSARIPALTREEAEVLEHLPETEREMPTTAAGEQSSLDEEKQAWALEKLEARGLIERLVDGQIVRTDAGEILAKAVSGARHLGHPVTPAIVRLLAAIRQVGTLYVKERKVRIQPEQWVEVERLAALGPQEFKEAVHVARMGQYIGEANITEAGMDLLAVQAQLKSKSAYSVAEQEQPWMSSM